MLAIRAGQLIDGVAAAPLRDVIVLIDGERITRVGPAQEVSIPPGSAVVDADSYTVMPGLIDAHVHIHSAGGPVENYSEAEIRGTQGLHSLRAYSYARRALRMGWTALRSMGSPAYVDVAVRAAIDEGALDGPRLRVAGQGLSVTGGHMDHGPWAPEVLVSSRTGVCDGPDGFRRAAREQFKRGADFVKINACVGSRYDLAEPWQQEMTYEEMAAVCQEAHWRHKRVAAHTSGGPGITDALRAGVDSLEHAHWLSDEQIDTMARQGTYLVPTLLVNSRSVAMARAGGQAEADPRQAWLLKVYDEKWETLARARAAGVKIAVGTDAGFLIDHGENACELEELVKGGFTPLEAITAATRVSAECLDIARETGTIAAGKYADIVMVDGDPLADIRILQRADQILQVYKGGKRLA